ncbi:mitochondrial ribosomal protein subunit L20-domain-containing protein [Roridomyces roridus]|uniref:Mitochondrial ribosomal protein subunit L20-domain-containing protein n=1 Tax=Roridomyces roridus TaxID=1738132 RepID=A0AAD7CAX3_9AGAR|nr:mitochondrial ribosomal protein subunit L20-domain-containing protein [Roridomyces roridus]
MLRSIASAPSFTRAYATKLAKWPRPKPGTAERPAYHAPDPLLNNPKAVVTELPDEDLTFIHRPPPTAPSPFSLTTNPVSPLLRPRPPQAEMPLPPPSRTPSKELPRASGQTMSEIRRLRALDPERYTCGVLARKFNVTRGFVQAIAALKKSQRKSKKRAQELVHQQARDKWSEKKTTLMMIKTKRRELW